MAGMLMRDNGVEGTADYISDILANFTIKDVVKVQTLVKAKGMENVLSVCERLATNDVSSLPVFDEEEKTCLGIVDFSDVVAYLLKMDWESQGSLKNGDSVWEELGKVPISRAIDLSERNPRVMIDETATLMEAITLFEEKRIRRALVESPDGDSSSKKVIAVLSPSAIVEFIMKELNGRADILMSKNLEELGIGFSPVQSIKRNQAVLEAMHLMHKTQHSVVAVVDPTNGSLSGSVSMSDIKLVFQERRFALLVGSCWKYIVEARERSDMEVFPFFGVHATDKLQLVVSKLLATNVHHLYVINDKLQPIKVVSFTDICAGIRRYFTKN